MHLDAYYVSLLSEKYKAENRLSFLHYFSAIACTLIKFLFKHEGKLSEESLGINISRYA